MNRVKTPAADLSPITEAVKERTAALWKVLRNPYNYLAAILVLAAFVVFVVDVKGSVVAILIAYMVAMLRLQLTRRELERQRLELANETLQVAEEQLAVLRGRRD